MGMSVNGHERDCCSRHPQWLSGWQCRRYFDYVNFNTTGFRPYVTTLYAVLLGCLRKTFSRVLVLIVSMGFGVVLPYLGAIQKKARHLLATRTCATTC